MFTVAFFIIAKMWKQHKCPLTDEWVNKIRIYATTWMNFKNIMPNEIRQTQKDKYFIIPHMPIHRDRKENGSC